MSRAPRIRSQHQVGFCGKLGEEPSPFRARCEAPFDSFERWKLCDIISLEVDPAAPRLQKTVDGFQCSSLSCAVWAHDYIDGTIFALHRDVPDDLGPSIASAHLLEFKQQGSCSPSTPVLPSHHARSRLGYLSRLRVPPRGLT